MIHLPQVREDILMQPFDASYNEQAYLLVIDSRHYEISHIIYEIILAIKEYDTYEGVAEYLSQVKAITISHEAFEEIINNKLIPMGLFYKTKDDHKKQSKYLWLRFEFFKSSWIKHFKPLSFLFQPAVFRCTLLCSCCILTALLVWFFSVEGFTIATDFHVDDLLIMFVLSMITSMIHEIGHMCALMKFELEPGNIGCAFYFHKPVLYSEVTNTWQLRKNERALVDIGGMYFETMILSIIAIISVFIGDGNLMISICLITIGMTFSLNPFLKWDGYWLFSDLIGIPNLHECMLKFYAEFLKGTGDHHSVIRHLNQRAKKWFFIYVTLCAGYMLFFSLIMMKLLITILLQLDELLSILNIVDAKAPLSFLMGYVYDHGITLILGIVCIRIMLISVKKIIMLWRGTRE